MNQKFRELTEQEIAQLKSQQCDCDNWSNFKVSQDFDPVCVRNVQFSGEIRIGSQNGKVTLPGGVERKAGIFNAALHNCTVGNNVYINKVDNYIANYDIEDGVVINHVRMLIVEGQTAFGNGTVVSVINEAGGREIPIYDHLSSHVAYMLALYRHNKELIEKLESFIQEYVDSVRSDRGLVGEFAKILNCGTIKNVKVGPYATIDSVSSLNNGTLNSSCHAPSFMGTNVIAKDFILCSGAKVSDSSIIEHVFVGQGTELAKQYSAENCVFFANCGGYHGEACAVFAGPYTVTHHKATLLIAGMYSFLNAGSGSNQSNHMYKLGPVHQGIVERGSKTTSDSYILWPAKVGAFSLVMGRHYANSDTSDLPFSYLIEHQNESLLIPGVNIRSVGTVRDSRKWPKRDKRKDPVKFDHIIFNLLTPYTVKKMIDGRELLKKLRDQAGPTSKFYYYNGVKIQRPSLENGIDFYDMGINRYLGNIIVQRIRQNGYQSIDDLRTILELKSDIGIGDWLDISGLIAPKEAIKKLINDILSGEIKTLDQVNDCLKELYDNFLDYELTWVKHVLEKKYNKPFEKFTSQDFVHLISSWIESVEKLDMLRIADARKEFTMTARTGFGVDGDDRQRDDDFENTRGNADENDFIMELQSKLSGKKNTAKELIDKIGKF